MKSFMGEDFLLGSQTAQTLFDSYAKDLPVFDYHNHLSARDIFERRRYDNIAQLWLGFDHYKWRAMRCLGIDERYITGNAPDKDKFLMWAATVEKIPGNPLYHWTHLELQRYFGISQPLTSDNAHDVWTRCNEMLSRPGYDAMSLLERCKVAALCTTDEPFDTLEWHIKLREDPSCKIKVLPAYRPDRFISIESDGFPEAIALLSDRLGMRIETLDDLKAALQGALDHFVSVGCILADHGFGGYQYGRGGDAGAAFAAALSGRRPSEEQIFQYKGELQRFLASEYCKRGMAMQMHIGAQRDNNRPMLDRLGPNCGCDSVGSSTDPALIGAYLNDLVSAGTLPNTVLYCLNPCDNAMLSTMAANFACAPVRGKVQFGSAWWFSDHVRGIQNQLNELMETGLISTFIGMLTDSRCLTSFCRHEYFRRILCDKLGDIMERGEYPNDLERMGRIVRDICYHNAVSFMGLH
ncbi:MAG: glucuronate isomerase [Synergistaceae bacterium]|jgi:glucuronate isomerase|nr:glucuronate isomerase [Synergistaceae bacterium]